LVAAVLVAACIAFIGRYQLSAAGYGAQNYSGQAIYRLDRWTGKVDACEQSTTKDGTRQRQDGDVARQIELRCRMPTGLIHDEDGMSTGSNGGAGRY
jgi:hypothetical protein